MSHLTLKCPRLDAPPLYCRSCRLYWVLLSNAANKACDTFTATFVQSVFNQLKHREYHALFFTHLFFVLLRCTQNHVAELELGRVHVLSPHKLIPPTRYQHQLVIAPISPLGVSPPPPPDTTRVSLCRRRSTLHVAAGIQTAIVFNELALFVS
jgi:hypothetical protein